MSSTLREPENCVEVGTPTLVEPCLFARPGGEQHDKWHDPEQRSGNTIPPPIRHNRAQDERRDCGDRNPSVPGHGGPESPIRKIVQRESLDQRVIAEQGIINIHRCSVAEPKYQGEDASGEGIGAYTSPFRLFSTCPMTRFHHTPSVRKEVRNLRVPMAVVSGTLRQKCQ
jgi:hypothetical protein